jgi:alpha-1,2-mannosyltransferase
MDSDWMRELLRRLKVWFAHDPYDCPAGAPALFPPNQMNAYPRLAIAAYVLAALILVFGSNGQVDANGRPLGVDFIAFWGASSLTLEGDPAAAFDEQRLSAAEARAVPDTQILYEWRYPPTFQLLVTPLAMLSYGTAFFLFIGGTLIAYLAVVRRFLDQPEPIVLLLAFPGTFICALQGQNAFLTATLFGAAILCLPRRPGLAGFLFALLVYKPQYGLLIPVALIAGRQWRAFLSASITLCAFVAVTVVVFGLDLWRIFFSNLDIVREMLERGEVPWQKMPSAFAFLRILGVPAAVAYFAQGTAIAMAVVAVVYVWRRCGPSLMACAVLVAATLVSLCYIFDYAFAIQSIPLSILATDMARRGANRWEKAALLIMVVIPLAMLPGVHLLHLQLGFPSLVLTLLLCVHRAIAERRAVSPTSLNTPKLVHAE